MWKIEAIVGATTMDTSETAMYDWHALPWRKLAKGVHKLQTRIYQASRRGETEAVHKLQRLLIHSRSAALLAVRRVAQDNQGKRTAGIDGVASLSDREKFALAEEVRRRPLISKAQPVRRVWIPKPGKDEKRPLGIPVMEDRARQALAKMALEPEWEAKFEPTSFGFRPGRSCHDAVEKIYRHMRNVPKYVLDADIAQCFDRINHEALLNKLGTFPSMRRAIKAWLKAGIMDGGTLFPVSEGTPQGGVISPLLANIALHGLATAIEDAFQAKKYPKGQKEIRWKPVVIRYADDFVILHRDLDALKQAKQIAAEWLQGMGLEMKPSKTRITHTLKGIDGPPGFDFLGFHFRQYPRGKNRCMRSNNGEPLGFTSSIRPSSESQKRLLAKIREILHSKRNASQTGLISLLNPIILGWGSYFSTVVSSEVFAKMDHLIFRKLWAWAMFRHRNKNRVWIARKYWLLGNHGWRFGNGDIWLHQLKDIPIRRHILVQSGRSPYDGDALYWSARTGAHPQLPRSLARLLKAQGGCCPGCGLFFKPGDPMQAVRRSDGRTTGQRGKLVLMHEHCIASPGKRSAMTTHHVTEEPDDGKLSRPVLETSMNGDVHA